MDLSNLQPIDPPKGDIKSKLSGLTPIGNVGEEKKNQETETTIPISTPTQGQAPTTQPIQQSEPTNNMGGGSNTTANTRTDNQVELIESAKKPTHFQDFVNIYSSTQEKSVVERTGYKMFDPKGKTVVESIPKPIKSDKPETEKVVKSDIGGVQTYFESEAPKTQTKTMTKPDDTKRSDGTEKGKGFYGDITVQTGEEQGKTMTELSAGYNVDGKEIEVPLLNPYTSLDDIENVRAGGEPSEQMYKDAERWLNYSLENNRSPFATEEETINVYTDEDNKIKFKSATDLQKHVATNMTEDERKILVGEPNPYAIGTPEYQDYANREAARDMISEQMEQFSKDTGFAPEAYLDYQNFLINGGESFDAWKKEYNPQSKIGVDEALALTFATLPTLIYDVVYRDGDMIERIAKGTTEFATGVRTGSIMGDISYITQGLFTLTKDGKYNPFRSAGELKQKDVEWVNRFDRNAKDEVAMFMGSIGADYLPFEVAGNLAGKMISSLTKANKLNYYNLAVKSGVIPESAMNVSEKIVSSGMQMASTLTFYTGAQSSLNQMMYSTPEEFIADGWKTVLNDVTASAVTGGIAGGIGGAMGVLTNQIKNRIIADAMKNGIMDATKLQKFAYVGTGVAGGTLSTILEASTFVAMSGEELNSKNILMESIKFATLKFQNPAGLKLDKLQNKTMIDPRFTPDKAWTKEFEPKLNSAELEMLGCKNVAEVKELVKKEGIDNLLDRIPVTTACKLANAEYGIVYTSKSLNLAPSEVAITSESVLGKKQSVVSTRNKQGELIHVSPHENYKSAAIEVEFITNKMQEYKVFKAADRLKPEWYAEFNQTANVDKIALNDALQAKNPTPEQLAVIKEFNKQVDDFISKKEKETPVVEVKKPKPPKEETKPVEIKEEKITLNDKEYTVRENEVFVKNEQGLLTRETNNDIIKQVKEQYDTQNKSGLPGEVREGQKPIETEPVKETSGEKIEAGRDVQTPEKEVSNKTQLFAAKGDKIESVSEKVMFTKAEVDIKVIREKTKAVNEVAKTHQEFARGIAKIAREAKNKGEISSAKYNTLINKIGQSIKDSRKTVDGEKVTVTAEQKRKEVVEWLETALANSAEAKYRSETKKNQRKAKKLFTIDKNPFGGKLNEVKEAANTDITLLNAEQLVSFREGLESIVKAGDRVTPKEINDFVNSVKEMGIEKIDKNPSEYISTILSQEIKTTADYDKAVREFRKALITADKMYREGKLTEAEFVEIVESLTKGENSIDVKIKIGGAEIKKEYLDGISEQTKEYNKKRQEGKDFGLSKPETELFDKTVTLASNKEVQAKMSIKDAELLDYALRNANEGFTNQFSLRAFDRLKTIYKENKMEAPLNEVISGDYFAKRSDRESKAWQETLDTVQWFRIDQLFKKAGRKVYDAIFFDSSSAVGNRKAFESKMLTDHAKARDKYFAEVKRNAIFRGAIDMISPKKAVREADVYSQIIRTELNHQSKIKSGEIPADMPSYFEAVMARKIPIGNVTRSQNYKDLMDVWGKIKSDPKFFKENGEFNIDYAKGKLSKKGLAYYDSFNKVFTELEPYIKMETEMSGRVFVPEVNYDGYHALIERTKAGNTKDIDIDTYISQVNNPIKHTGSIYERRNIVELIRTDGSRLLIEQVRNIGDNIYIKPEYKSTHDALKNYAKRNPESGNLINAMQKSIARRVVLESHGEQTSAGAKATSFVVGKTSKLVLGVITRIPQEGLVNVARNLGSVGTNPKEFFKKENPVYKEMLEGLMSDKNFMSSMGEYLEKGNKSLGTKAVEAVIIAADAYVVPRTFKTAFDKEYKKQTGKEFDTKAYESDYMYRFKNSEAIRQAKIEGLSRVQELFNTKTSIENPPDIRLFGRNYKKTSTGGQLAYMLQSFGANEKTQMGKAFLNIKEGIKTGDADMRNTGIRDALTIPLTNFLYLQIGLLSSSVMRQLYDDEFWKTGDFSGLQDGWNEYQDKYLNPAAQAKSFVASLSTLAIGKYGNFVPVIAGTIYAYIDADKDIPADTKSILAEISKGAHIKPVNLSSKSYGSIGGALAGLHPVSKELVNLFDMVEQAAMVANIGSYSGDDKLDKDDEALADFILNFIRYAYPNPISNQIKRMQSKTKREIKDSTKTNSKITTDGTKTTDSKIALPDTKPLK